MTDPAPPDKPTPPGKLAPPTDGKGDLKKVSSFRAYFARRPDPLTGLVLTLPVFLLYHLGLLLIDLKNGADWVSTLSLQLLENQWVYAAVTVGLAATLVGVTWLLRRSGRLASDQTPRRQAPWLLLESVLLAILMRFSLGWATETVFQAGGTLSKRGLGVLEKLVLSAGAGFPRRARLPGDSVWWRHLPPGQAAAATSEKEARRQRG